jgi:hypothetical protein
MWVWFALERYRANSPAIRWYGGMLSIFGSARIMRATAWRASVRYRNYWSEVVTLQNHLPVSRFCSAEVLFLAFRSCLKGLSSWWQLGAPSHSERVSSSVRYVDWLASPSRRWHMVFSNQPGVQDARCEVEQPKLEAGCEQTLAEPRVFLVLTE